MLNAEGVYGREVRAREAREEVKSWVIRLAGGVVAVVESVRR